MGTFIVKETKTGIKFDLLTKIKKSSQLPKCINQKLLA